MNIGYNIIYNIVALIKACKDWNKLQAQEKIWTHFKCYFSEAYSEYEEFNQDSNTN